MENLVVSFCIATFQRYEVVLELITEILSVQSSKFEVVVCDDKSSDDSVKKLKAIKDNRLKIYVNNTNVGSLLNIHEALDRGRGKYLFYINDRDSIDKFKILKLIEILEFFENENIAFAKCVSDRFEKENYKVFGVGGEALIKFACRMDHPTGFIFKKEIWCKISYKRMLFENQKYGDYVITQICAIMAQKYKGAWIYGDICDVKRHRIDFSKVKSGYYNKRKDKRLWYTPEVIFRELKIGQKFLDKLGIKNSIKEQIFIERYTEYLSLCVSRYKDIISDPTYTAHYGIYPSQNIFITFITSLFKGIKLWGKTYLLYLKCNKELCKQINQITKKEYILFLKNFYKDNSLVKCKIKNEIEKKNIEINKREFVLKVYEKWVDRLLEEKKITKYLMQNNYQNVAIYGMGRMGRQLFKEFAETSISVAYVIDREISKFSDEYKTVPCYSMDKQLPYVDLIIITIPSEEENIKDQLRKKVKWQIESINDLLYVIS